MAASNTPASCGGCPATWTGVAKAHCAGCHHTFAGTTLFDKHRRRSACVEPSLLGFQLIDGIWKSAEADDRFAHAS